MRSVSGTLLVPSSLFLALVVLALAPSNALAAGEWQSRTGDASVTYVINAIGTHSIARLSDVVYGPFSPFAPITAVSLVNYDHRRCRLPQSILDLAAAEANLTDPAQATLSTRMVLVDTARCSLVSALNRARSVGVSRLLIIGSTYDNTFAQLDAYQEHYPIPGVATTFNTNHAIKEGDIVVLVYNRDNGAPLLTITSDPGLSNFTLSATPLNAGGGDDDSSSIARYARLIVFAITFVIMLALGYCYYNSNLCFPTRYRERPVFALHRVNIDDVVDVALRRHYLEMMGERVYATGATTKQGNDESSAAARAARHGREAGSDDGQGAVVVDNASRRAEGTVPVGDVKMQTVQAVNTSQPNEREDATASVSVPSQQTIARCTTCDDGTVSRLGTCTHDDGSEYGQEEEEEGDEEGDEEGELCPICLEEYQDGDVLRPLPCMHEYHKECIDQWLMENTVCPLCKTDVIEVMEMLINGQDVDDDVNGIFGEFVEQRDSDVASDGTDTDTDTDTDSAADGADHERHEGDEGQGHAQPCDETRFSAEASLGHDDEYLDIVENDSDQQHSLADTDSNPSDCLRTETNHSPEGAHGQCTAAAHNAHFGIQESTPTLTDAANPELAHEREQEPQNGSERWPQTGLHSDDCVVIDLERR